MPNLPVKWRRWCYGVSIAALPVLTAYGVLDGNKAAALASMAGAVFIGGLAARNARDPK